MDTPGASSSLGAYLKANRTFFLLALLIVVSVSGYFWYRSGFTLEIGKFFASSCSDIGLFDSQAQCRNTCVANPDACVFRASSGCYRVPNGVECGNGCDPYGPPNCTAINPSVTAPPNIGGCANAAIPWSATFDIPTGVTGYQTATFHDPQPGCTRTTVEAGSGGSVTSFNTTAGTYSVKWDPSLDVHCGRYQFDVNLGGGQGVGKVFNYGVACGAATTQPPATSPPLVPLVCAPVSQTVIVGQSAAITATGGTGSFAWTAPGGTPGSATGSPFSVSYATPGFKTVTVASGGNQAACVVTVTAPATSNPPASPVCSPATQSVTSGTNAAVGGSGGTTPYTWSAPDGNPASGSGNSFSTLYSPVVTPPSPASHTITMTDKTGQTATCSVAVNCPIPVACPAPPAGCTYQGANQCTCGTLVCQSNVPLVCSPANRTMSIGQSDTWQAGGGSGSYAWSAPGANNTAGSGQYFATSYGSSGNFTITVTDSQARTAVCNVAVNTTAPPTTITPPPTAPSLTLQKLVRNVSQSGSEAKSVSANPADTVEFSLRVSSVGTASAVDVTVRDALPSGLSYQPGTTTIDSVPAADGIVSTGLNLGTLTPGRTVTVRFRATVAPEQYFNAGTTTLTNTAYARAANAPELSDVAFVSVTRNPQNPSMSLTKLGRNTTRGQTGENSPVYASPGETLGFIVHIRNTSSTALTNVLVRDIMPSGISYVPGSAQLNNQPVSDTLVTSGANIGTLAPGQEAVVTFSGRVAGATELPGGTTTLINTVQASADGVPALSAQLPIIIVNPAAVTHVPTGPGESTILALVVSAIVTLLYVGYTSTDVYRRREAGELADQARREKDRIDFRR